MSVLLKVEELSKHFGNHIAVDAISFQIERGKIYGLLGPNGSGKSTTLGMVLGVVNKTSGEFRWFDGQKSLKEALRKVGALIERPNFYPYMTAEQNLRLVCKIKESSYENIDPVLKMVNLLDRKKSKFKTFSLGMKQRLAIASALLNNPEILILDEPTNGLDPQGIHQIREIITDIAANGTTILLASHLLAEVEKVCTDILVIRKGLLLHQGPITDLRSTSSYLELKAEDEERLVASLEMHPKLNRIDASQKPLYKVYFTEDIPAESINKYLMQKEVYVCHLLEHKTNLEDYFLQLTKEE